MYLCLYIHIYIYVLLCSIMGCFFLFIRSEMLPGMRLRMGRATSNARKPILLQFFVGFRHGAVIATVARNIRRRLGAPCRKWGSRKQSVGLSSSERPSGFGVKMAFYRGVQEWPELRGTKRVFTFTICYLQDEKVLKLDNFPETTKKRSAKMTEAENAVFCTGASEIGHLRSGSKVVPIYFSLRCTSFAIHLWEHKENCLIFLPFHFVKTCPFLSCVMIAFCCAISTCVSHGSVRFLCSCWLCCCFWVPLLLIILDQSLFYWLWFCFLFSSCLSFFGCISSCSCCYYYFFITSCLLSSSCLSLS